MGKRKGDAYTGYIGCDCGLRILGKPRDHGFDDANDFGCSKSIISRNVREDVFDLGERCFSEAHSHALRKREKTASTASSVA